MYDEINQKLETAHQGMFSYQKMESMLEELKGQSEALKEKTAELKEILQKEDIDVEKLEGKSLAHILHTVLGNLDEKLVKERQEALAAQLKYDQAVKDLEKVDAQISQLLADRIEYKDCQMEYNRLLTQKKDMLLLSDSGTAEQILKISQQQSQLKNHDKELKEAIDAGKKALYHIGITSESLNSAEGWGTWDLLGGGLISDMMKHSNLDDAKGEVDKVQEALTRFRTELADVRITSNINIDTDGFGKFADFFFDGLIADWSMQSRINASQESVEAVRSQVESVLDKLENMAKEAKNQTGTLERQLKDLISQAK